MLSKIASFFKKRPGPIDNVTPRVQRLFVLARKQADANHHRYVGTEHLLLALIELGEGVGYAALQQLKINPALLRESIRVQIKPGPTKPTPPAIPYTPMFKKVLNMGNVEAREMGKNYLGTEHVLLGMLRGSSGLAKRFLKAQGVTLESAREAVSAVSQSEASSDRGSS